VHPRTQKVRRIKVGSKPYDVLFAAGSVWTHRLDEGALVRPSTERSRDLGWS